MTARKCLSIAAVVTVAAVLAAAPAMAGDYHAGLNLICSDCHTMHYSVSHGYDGGTAPTLGTGPNERLLKAPVADLCLTCHDGSTSAPDVLNANTGTHVREAGALTTLSGNTGGYDIYMGHTLGSTDPAPGGTWTDTNGLTCTDCHSAHNAPNASTIDVFGHTTVNPYRNLSRRAGGSSNNITVSYVVGTNDPNYDVNETDATLGQIPTHYSIDNVRFNEPVTTMSGMGEFCKKCHTNFHGSHTDANMRDSSHWLRHPTADADLGSTMSTQYSGHANKVKIMGSGTTGTPSCMSCHKGHGNKNAFGLIYMAGTGTVTTEEGDDGTTIRDLCRQCHSQGTPY